ncbi:MAG TPA: ABC transporter permease [Amaricoccus sp.]|uniref:ABC transporter permease n=1 Tax=Amaricoccus sp. TaxID=1872485 RepID=UPI002BB95351|nr:ABC transporter permease [Amaricoccus sp.]HMQ91878.1 ABC transporter permease [Amaricoccus sp.]HMR53399.1 ABC transporter permease [Amaricoccus sp.]HMR61186.1 ABC transporter permease [Amaricoccus sp.]HMU00404.1 ABC transporter permease [Amaricoccus sp.]
MPPEPSSSGAGPRRYRPVLAFILDNLVWLILLVALTAFGLFIPKFLQIGIFLNILEQSTFVGVIAVGLSLTLVAGEMDLSVESVMALAAMLVALTFGTGGAGGGLELHPAWLAFPVSLAMALGIGAAVGALNGLLVVRFEINAFIVTLASYIWGRGLVVALSGGRSVYGLPDALRGVAVQRLLGVPLLAWVLIVVYLAFAFLLAKTPFGRHLFMIGGNAVASNRAGIRVARNVILAFLLSGMLAGLAGWLLASRTAGATANLGIGMLFQAFAAVVIGGVSLRGGVGRLSGVFAGVLLLSSIQTAINVMGMPPHYTMMIQGLLVLAAVLLDTAKNNLRRSYF